MSRNIIIIEDVKDSRNPLLVVTRSSLYSGATEALDESSSDSAECSDSSTVFPYKGV